MTNHIDPDGNEAILARHRRAPAIIHPDVAEPRRAEIERERTALGNAQEQLQTAISHLQKVLNGCRSADEQMKADTAARLARQHRIRTQLRPS